MALFLRLKMHKGVRYIYPLTSLLTLKGFASSHPHKKIIGIIRFITLILLMLLIAKPQLIDPRSTVRVEGVDIVLLMDVSGSMDMPHHSDDNRSRLQVAKEEAVRFIDKRTNDAIGVVIFGNDALSRCPLTADKHILKQIIQELHIGVVDPDGTKLATSIVTAANRLKQSHAKSKIMILLTDGEPSEHDMDPEKALEVAKKLGIKIYTVGIGDNQELLVRHPLHGVVAYRTTLNKPLLTKIATETGGKFFEAKNAKEIRQIYDTIDTLEKTEISAPVFSKVLDWFMPLVWIAFILVLLEILLTSFVWFSL